MKSYINYIKESKEKLEKSFLENSHLDKLVIEFNFFGNNKEIYYYFYDLRVNISETLIRKQYFIYDKKSKELWMNCYEIIPQLYDDFSEMKNIIEKYFNVDGIIIKRLWDYTND